MKTNAELGAVYLDKRTLDKERFKELIEGMDVASSGLDCYLEYEIDNFIENYRNPKGEWEWICASEPEPEAKLITLEELEDLLNKDTFILPEKWCIKQDACQEACDWHKAKLGSNAFLEGGFKYMLNQGEGLCYDTFSNSIPQGYTEITASQFKKYVLKQQQEINMENKKVTITREALREVYNFVCSDYKDKINKLLQSDLFSSEIEVEESIIQQAHKDATNEHHRDWLKKYLPLPEKKKIEILSCLRSIPNKVDINSNKGLQSLRFTNFKLIKLGYGSGGTDVFTAEHKEEGFFVLIGHWNDGVL